jgi:NAD(P)-dependent dehydrogenase (short-subunit alcohol dehydrogenase family)
MVLTILIGGLIACQIWLDGISRSFSEHGTAVLASRATTRLGYAFPVSTQEREEHMGKLDGKVAVITGATSGIGAETARLFVAEGARVVIGGRRGDLCRGLAAELGEAVVPLTMKVTKEDSHSAAADLAMSRFGRLDCYFNNAGSAGVLGPISATPASGLDDTISVLFRAVVLGTKHAARVMEPQGFGTVINNASIAAFFTGYAPHIYSARKAAVVQLTRSVATELGERGLRVNCVCPGAGTNPYFLRSVWYARACSR